MFLKVRNVDIPNGLSKEELIELIISKRDIPIIQLTASKDILKQLVHQQLVNYLGKRGYVILGKGKLSMIIPDIYREFQENELLNGALKDFDDNYAKDLDSINLALEEILNERYSIIWYETFVLKRNCYQQGNLDSVLQKFGIIQSDISFESMESKAFQNNFFNPSLNEFMPCVE